MTQHYTKNTAAVMVFCNTCNRKTRHRVSDGRQGLCLEHGGNVETLHATSLLSKAQVKARKKREEEAKSPEMF